VKKKPWRADLDINANLRRALPKLARNYFKAGDRALLKDRGWEEVHDFRITTKRFRYTLELFGSFYGPGFKERIEELKQVQYLLGAAHDCLVAAELLKPISGTEQVREELNQKAEAKLKRARSWWRANLGSEAAQHRWITYLQRSSRASAASTPGPSQEAALKSAG
jgi:CHAD domain-containing protein